MDIDKAFDFCVYLFLSSIYYVSTMRTLWKSRPVLLKSPYIKTHILPGRSSYVSYRVKKESLFCNRLLYCHDLHGDKVNIQYMTLRKPAPTPPS